MKQKLPLSENSKMIGGVCGGLAESLGVDPSFARIGCVILFAFMHGLTVLLYIIMWAILPRGIQ